MSFGGSRRKYPALTCQEVKKILGALGFEKRAANAGSHESWVKTDEQDRFYKVTVDCPKAPFSIDLIKSMIRQAGVSREIFYNATTKTAKKLSIKSQKEKPPKKPKKLGVPRYTPPASKRR